MKAPYLKFPNSSHSASEEQTKIDIESLYTLYNLHKDDVNVNEEFQVKVDSIKSKYKAEEAALILQQVLYKAVFDGQTYRQLLPLIDNGANINATMMVDGNEGTILFFAIQAQRWDLLDRLVSNTIGADISIANKYDINLLLNATEACQFAFVRKLIQLLLQETNGIQNLLQRLSVALYGENSKQLIAKTIEICCDSYQTPGSMKALQDIYENNKVQFKQFVQLVDSKYSDFLNNAIKAGFPDEYKYISPFACGTGRIDYDSGLVACAAVAAEKNSDYKFDPTVLNGYDELKEYFTFINDNMASMDGQSYKFVISGAHWISGVIEIKDGKPTILFVDSMGGENLDPHLLGITEQIFSSSNIIVANQERQTSAKGCSVFALDDIRKLFKVTELSPDLSPSMMRTTQSLTKIENDRGRPEQQVKYDKPVNRKGDSFDESLKENLKPRSPDDSKLINTRIAYKLSKLCEKVTSFVSGKPDEAIQEAKHGFSLDGFKERISKSLHHTKRI